MNSLVQLFVSVDDFCMVFTWYLCQNSISYYLPAVQFSTSEPGRSHPVK